MKTKTSAGTVVVLGIAVVLMLSLMRSEVRADTGDHDLPRATPCYAVCMAYGCPPPPPCLSADFTYKTFLPQAARRSFPYPVSNLYGVYLEFDVDLILDMGGAPGSGVEYFHATTVITVRERADDGTTSVWICYYGVWPNGAGAAKCNRIEL